MNSFLACMHAGIMFFVDFLLLVEVVCRVFRFLPSYSCAILNNVACGVWEKLAGTFIVKVVRPNLCLIINTSDDCWAVLVCCSKLEIASLLGHWTQNRTSHSIAGSDFLLNRFRGYPLSYTSSLCA